MDKLVFGDQSHTTLCKKIDLWARGMTRNKIQKYRVPKSKQQKYDTMIAHIEDYSQEVSNYKGSDKWKESLVNKEKKICLGEFLSEHIIPGLVESGFFDTYEPRYKKDDQDRVMKNYYLF